MKKYKISVKECPTGFSLWVNGRWVIEASMFDEEQTITVDLKRLIPQRKDHWEERRNYLFKPDEWDARIERKRKGRICAT